MGTKYENLLDSGSGNVIQSFYDNFLKSNADFRAKAGFRMTVTREPIGACCDWCADLAGTYDYDNRPADIYARHKNCTCIVVTRTERGTYQDAWSRKEYDTYRDARIAREKEILKEQNNKINPKEVEQVIFAKKHPISDKNFSTLNFTKMDSVRPASIRKELAKSEVGRETLKFISDNDVFIQLLYGCDNPDRLAGYYDSMGDEIVVFGDVTLTIKETALTVIHEIKHMQNKFAGMSPFAYEYASYEAEYLHLKGILTEQDKLDIIKLIKDLYGYDPD